MPPRVSLPDPPGDLSADSRALWPGLAADVVSAMGGAEVDFLRLADVLRARDRLAAVTVALERDGVTVAGSKGQLRPHPLLTTEASLRREVADGLAALKLGARDRYNLRVRARRLLPETYA